MTTPRGAAVQAKAASRLSLANFPKRYAAEITKQPAAVPTMTDALTTPVFGYAGVFPGPRLELDRGTPAVMRVRNHLPAVGPFGSPAATSTHLHGSASLPEYDGCASDTTAVGQFKDYHYPNFQPARTMWYHDHGVHWTAQQAYGGRAAMYILHDLHE